MRQKLLNPPNMTREKCTNKQLTERVFSFPRGVRAALTQKEKFVCWPKSCTHHQGPVLLAVAPNTFPSL